MVSSSWGAPKAFAKGFDPSEVGEENQRACLDLQSDIRLFCVDAHKLASQSNPSAAVMAHAIIPEIAITAVRAVDADAKPFRSADKMDLRLV